MRSSPGCVPGCAPKSPWKSARWLLSHVSQMESFEWLSVRSLKIISNMSLIWLRIRTSSDLQIRLPKDDLSCLSWNWRRRSSVKITERTHEKRAKTLHRRREGGHPEAALVG